MNQVTDFLPSSDSVDVLFDSGELKKMLSSSLLAPLAEFLERPAKNFRSQLVELGVQLSHHTEPEKISVELLSEITKASAIVELIHSGSLIVDDIQDSSQYRRNQPALHVIHGVPVALNAGNWLYFWALSQLRTLNLSSEVTEDILSLMMKAHAGQAIDVGTRIDLVLKKSVHETCLASMELKTGTLMNIALRIGAGLSGKKFVKEDLYNLGTTLGILLQIHDDIGNFLKPSAKQFEDLRLKRPTWIWCVASQYDERTYSEFIEAVNELPDDMKLQRWCRRNHFKEQLLSQVDMFRALCDVACFSTWKSSHPESMKKIKNLIKNLESAYV